MLSNATENKEFLQQKVPDNAFSKFQVDTLQGWTPYDCNNFIMGTEYDCNVGQETDQI